MKIKTRLIESKLISDEKQKQKGKWKAKRDLRPK